MVEEVRNIHNILLLLEYNHFFSIGRGRGYQGRGGGRGYQGYNKLDYLCLSST